MNDERLKSSLLIALLLLLTFPIIQDITHILKPIPLTGAIAYTQYVKLTMNNWFRGSFQDSLNLVLKEKTGIRPDLTRFSNQIDFTFFKKVHEDKVIIGSDGYLFLENYVAQYCGRSRMSHADMLDKLIKLKKIEDTLAKIGVKTIYVQSGCKASFYPEYIPNQVSSNKTDLNNHELFNKIADSLNITTIDFNDWMVDMKPKTNDRLFTKQGIHWSIYGSVLAADSFTRYLNSKNAAIPKLIWKKGKPHTSPMMTDADLFNGLNIMELPYKDTFYYPDISYTHSIGIKPKMIFISDSFLWSWIDNKILDNISSEWDFWYYHTDRYSSHAPKMKLNDFDWGKELKKADILVLMFTASNIDFSCANPIQGLYDYLYGYPHPKKSV